MSSWKREQDNLRDIQELSTRVRVLSEQITSLVAIIVTHNQRCRDECNSGGRCADWINRGRHCSNCTLDWLIEEEDNWVE